jgi:hypothetical protein
MPWLSCYSCCSLALPALDALGAVTSRHPATAASLETLAPKCPLKTLPRQTPALLAHQRCLRAGVAGRALALFSLHRPWKLRRPIS